VLRGRPCEKEENQAEKFAARYYAQKSRCAKRAKFWEAEAQKSEHNKVMVFV
jgi:hypothetical protein